MLPPDAVVRAHAPAIQLPHGQVFASEGVARYRAMLQEQATTEVAGAARGHAAAMRMHPDAGAAMRPHPAALQPLQPPPQPPQPPEQRTVEHTSHEAGGLAMTVDASAAQREAEHVERARWARAPTDDSLREWGRQMYGIGLGGPVRFGSGEASLESINIDSMSTLSSAGVHSLMSAAVNSSQWGRFARFLGRTSALLQWQRAIRMVIRHQRVLAAILELVEQRRARDARRVALAMGMHPRLGAHSSVLALAGMEPVVLLIVRLMEREAPYHPPFRARAGVVAPTPKASAPSTPEPPMPPESLLADPSPPTTHAPASAPPMGTGASMPAGLAVSRGIASGSGEPHRRPSYSTSGSNAELAALCLAIVARGEAGSSDDTMWDATTGRWVPRERG